MSYVNVEELLRKIEFDCDEASEWHPDNEVISVDCVKGYIHTLSQQSPQPTKTQDTEDIIEQLQDKVLKHSHTSVIHDEEIISTEDVLKLIEDTLRHDKQPKTAPVPSSKSYLHSRITKELNAPEEAVCDDKVNKPNHYVGVKGLEVEEVLQNFLPKYKDPYTSHRVGSAIEYQLRSPEKNGLEDLRKARKNLDQAIAYEESKEEDKRMLVEEVLNQTAFDNIALYDNSFETMPL